MVLSDVEETVTIVEVEDENEDEAVRVFSPPVMVMFGYRYAPTCHIES
jgi:hypothetical protein